jgi:glucose-1-phosphate thymidylyltransferase
VTNRKGIILAGGSGTRLYPSTKVFSKQLVPIYDKPMIYYPLSLLMLAGISDIALISTPRDVIHFENLLGNGERWGMNLSYIKQHSPDGLAQAYLLAEDFLAGAPSAMILGDNLFYGQGLTKMLRSANRNLNESTVFAHQVSDPHRYGVVEFDDNYVVRNVVEKPISPLSNYAITGLYFFDGDAPNRAKKLQPSARGELEIVDLIKSYMIDVKLKLRLLGRGFSWFDAGTNDALLDASNFVRTINRRQGVQIGCPEEVALNNGWLSKTDLRLAADAMQTNSYSEYIRSII